MNKNIYEILDQTTFKGYLCKSDMALYKGKVFLNYAYSPFLIFNFIKKTPDVFFLSARTKNYMSTIKKSCKK